MSNYTGGYQFSHMHQSLDADDFDGQMIGEDLNDYNNIIKVPSAHAAD